MPKKRLNKNQKKRLKRRAARDASDTDNTDTDTAAPPSTAQPVPASAPSLPSDVKVEYVSADMSDAVADVGGSAQFEEFQRIFSKFTSAQDLTAEKAAATPTNGAGAGADAAGASASADASAAAAAADAADKPQRLSRRKRKALSRLSVAELKQLVARPDVVDTNDVDSADPKLLVWLKSYRNTVQVPRHWSAKRKYLQGKRGIEKAPFQLPDYIADTGIAKLREAADEADDKKKLKSRTRDRVQPKMGRVEIDYQILHDAFFKFQTKPALTRPGDLYFEGKEFEVKQRDFTPGVMSDRLKEALGMTSELAPPPWLLHMQRYGPPPSYPNLKLPGLSAPIPAGASFGFHLGGWGKPPVDEMHRPLYGDVFGTMGDAFKEERVEVDKTLWGELVSESSEDESSEEDDSDDDASDDDDDGGGVEDGDGDAADVMAGTDTPLMTDHSGLGTPDTIDLRKGRLTGLETPETPALPEKPQELFQVLEQRTARVGAGQILGSSHRYDMGGVVGGADGAGAGAGAGAGGGTDSVAPASTDGSASVAHSVREKEKKKKKKTTAKNVF